MQPLRNLRDADAALRCSRQQPVQPLCAVQRLQTGATNGKHAVTRRIKHASSSVELLQIYGANRHVLDDIHLSAFFGKLANTAGQLERSGFSHKQHRKQQKQQLAWHYQDEQQQPGLWELQQQMQHPWQHQQQLLSALLIDLHRHIPTMRPRAVSSILWALSKLQLFSTDNQQQQQHLQQQQGNQAQPQEQQLIVQLLHRAQQLGFSSFEPRQLSTMAYALIRFTSKQATTTSSSRARQQGQQLHFSCHSELLHGMYAALGSSLHCCTAHDAAQAIYAAAQLEFVPADDFLQQWLSRAHQLLPHFTPQGLANSAYGLVRVLELSGQLTSSTAGSSEASADSLSVVLDGTQDYRPAAVMATASAHWLQRCMRVSVLHLPTMQPGELYGQLLWACGKLRCSPPEPAYHSILAHSRSLLAHCDTQQLATALYCFALLQQQPPKSWINCFWDQVARKLTKFQGLAMAKMLWAAAQLQLQPPVQLLPLLLQRVTHLVDKSNAGCLVSVLYSMVCLGLQLSQRYLVRFQSAVVLQVQRFSSRDYSNMLWALATARVKVDERWLEQVLMSSTAKLSSFSATDLSLTLWAVAKLRHTPSKPWLQQLLSSSLRHLPHFKPSHFANMLCALGRLHSAPKPLWLSSFWSTSGPALTKFSPAELTAVVTGVLKLQLQPPGGWVQAVSAAVDHNLAMYDSARLLYMLRAIQQLQVQQAGGVSGIGVLQYGSNNGCRGYIYSSSIVPYGRLKLQQQYHVLGGSSSLHAAAGPDTEQLMSLSAKQSQQVHGQSQVASVLQQLDGFASEAYSMACLVVLMPEWLQQRVAHWPKQLAAGRALPAQSSEYTGAALTGSVASRSDAGLRLARVAALRSEQLAVGAV